MPGLAGVCIVGRALLCGLLCGGERGRFAGRGSRGLGLERPFLGEALMSD